MAGRGRVPRADEEEAGATSPIGAREPGILTAPWLPPVVVAIVLTVASGWYGLARDELYFRMLDPAWGYVDQPPLIPLLARTLGASPWTLRIPATISAALSVWIVMMIARDLGGDRRVQAWTGWAYAGTVAVLNFGHVLLTSALDLAVWPLVCLLVIRAELHDRRWAWLVAGTVAGLATFNRLLVGLLVAGIALGMLLLGPRRRLLSAEVVGGAVLAVLFAGPNIAYQVVNSWPQLDMGAALSANNAGEVRWLMGIILVLVLGPPLAWVCAVGVRGLWRRDDWRPVRFLLAPLVLVVAFTFASGAQPHYPTFILPVFLAAGMVELGQRLDRGTRWRWLVGVNAAVAAVVALPLLPPVVLGQTPIPAINILARDQVGWPTYSAQVVAVHDALPPHERATAVVVTSNYGEAGAIAFHAPDLAVFSGHNALFDRARPPDHADVVVFVGYQLASATDLFTSCEVPTRLDNGVGVDNEEQGAPVAVCRDPLGGWEVAWPALRHLD